MKKQTKLREILTTTREWAEEIARHSPHHYKRDLCGLCAIVSKELFKRLTEAGFECSVGYNIKHCFVLYKSRILDLTASQFGKPRIYIPSIKGKEERHWEIEEEFTNIDELSNHQEKEGWFNEQIYI